MLFTTGSDGRKGRRLRCNRHHVNCISVERNDSPISLSLYGRSVERGLFAVVSVVLRPRLVAWNMASGMFVDLLIRILVETRQ
jgi:hypothetical protein